MAGLEGGNLAYRLPGIPLPSHVQLPPLQLSKNQQAPYHHFEKLPASWSASEPLPTAPRCTAHPVARQSIIVRCKPNESSDALTSIHNHPSQSKFATRVLCMRGMLTIIPLSSSRVQHE